MDIKTITAKDNAAIKKYKKLAASKKARRSENLFVLEGKRLIFDAFENGVRFENIFVTQSAYEKNPADARELAEKNENVFALIGDNIGTLISETQTTQGFFAICKMPLQTDIDELLSTENGNYIVASGLQDPGNMGTILRTCDALGIDAVFACRSCEVFSPKTVRSAMGAAFRVKVFDVAEDELFEKFEKYDVETYAAVLIENSETLCSDTFRKNGKNAVFIGNEGNGLEKNVYERCSRKIIIPMNENAESLNAAMAAGIFMWEMKKQSGRGRDLI